MWLLLIFIITNVFSTKSLNNLTYKTLNLVPVLDILSARDVPWGTVLYTKFVDDVDVAKQIFGTKNCGFLVRSFEFSEAKVPLSYVVSAHVIFPKNHDDLTEALERIYRSYYWNSNIRTVICVESNVEVTGYFRIAWKYYVLDVWVVSGDDVYSYNPVKYSCKDLGVALVKNNDFRTVEVREFNGCAIKLIYMRFIPHTIYEDAEEGDGFEVVIVKEALKRIGLSLEVLEHNFTTWGVKDANGTYSGMYNWLDDGKVQIVVGIIYAREIIDFDYSYPFYFFHYGLYTPKASELEPWRNLLIIFDLKVWLATLISLLVVLVAWMKLMGDNLSEAWFAVLGYMFAEISFHQQPSYRRIFFIAWVIFCFFILSCYQSLLIAFLFIPGYEHQITTALEGFQNGLTLEGFYELRNFLDINNSREDYEMYHRIKRCPLIGLQCINRMIDNKDLMYYTTHRMLNYNIRKDPRKYHFMYSTEKSSSKSGIMMVGKGYFGLDRINRVILNMQETGLVNKWDKYLRIVPVVHEPKHFTKLNTSHLMIPFIFIVIAETLSFITFVFELIYHYKFNK